jgi:hypothetical protein
MMGLEQALTLAQAKVLEEATAREEAEARAKAAEERAKDAEAREKDAEAREKDAVQLARETKTKGKKRILDLLAEKKRLEKKLAFDLAKVREAGDAAVQQALAAAEAEKKRALDAEKKGAVDVAEAQQAHHAKVAALEAGVQRALKTKCWWKRTAMVALMFAGWSLAQLVKTGQFSGVLDSPTLRDLQDHGAGNAHRLLQYVGTQSDFTLAPVVNTAKNVLFSTPPVPLSEESGSVHSVARADVVPEDTTPASSPILVGAGSDDGLETLPEGAHSLSVTITPPDVALEDATASSPPISAGAGSEDRLEKLSAGAHSLSVTITPAAVAPEEATAVTTPISAGEASEDGLEKLPESAHSFSLTIIPPDVAPEDATAPSPPILACAGSADGLEKLPEGANSLSITTTPADVAPEDATTPSPPCKGSEDGSEKLPEGAHSLSLTITHVAPEDAIAASPLISAGAGSEDGLGKSPECANSFKLTAGPFEPAATDATASKLTLVGAPLEKAPESESFTLTVAQVFAGDEDVMGDAAESSPTLADATLAADLGHDLSAEDAAKSPPTSAGVQLKQDLGHRAASHPVNTVQSPPGWDGEGVAVLSPAIGVRALFVNRQSIRTIFISPHCPAPEHVRPTSRGALLGRTCPRRRWKNRKLSDRTTLGCSTRTRMSRIWIQGRFSPNSFTRPTSRDTLRVRSCPSRRWKKSELFDRATQARMGRIWIRERRFPNLFTRLTTRDTVSGTTYPSRWWKQMGDRAGVLFSPILYRSWGFKSPCDGCIISP